MHELASSHNKSRPAIGKEGEKKHTVLQVREQLCIHVLGYNTDVGLDVVVENETRRKRGFVLPAPSHPFPADGRVRFRRRHIRGDGSVAIEKRGGAEIRCRDAQILLFRRIVLLVAALASAGSIMEPYKPRGYSQHKHKIGQNEHVQAQFQV